jgi:anti-anti-sigma factor
MARQEFKHLVCPAIVLRVREAQVMGDTLADSLRDEFLAAYLASAAVHVVLDMGEVGYLSSAGVRPLLTLNRHVHEREGRLVLSNLTPGVESVLSATRLISTAGASPAAFEKQPDVPAAVASLYAGG